MRKMVKGRRVRAVVTCARNDDSCPPNPKRRAQKILFDSAVLQSNKPNAIITAYFQNVDVKQSVVTDGTQFDEHHSFGSIADEDILIALCDNDFMPKKEVPKTPVMVKQSNAFNDGTPLTPHRIELCGENGVKEENKIKKDIPKTKKRMNNLAANYNKTNHKLTEYFPIRRSERKTEKTVLQEKQRTLEQILRSEREDGLEIRTFEDKGRGVVTSRPFSRGDFVVEYSGDLIDIAEAKRREQQYAQDLNTGCYMYYFKHNNQQYCVDATKESGKLGRLVNHSRNGNLTTRTVFVDQKPRLILIAKENIDVNVELTYDYGDRSKESLKHHPWLAN